MLSYNTSVQNISFYVKRRQQTQKIPSFLIFRLAAGGVGGAANKKCRKFLGFAPRELAERGRGAVSISFVQNGFEQSYIIPQRKRSKGCDPK